MNIRPVDFPPWMHQGGYYLSIRSYYDGFKWKEKRLKVNKTFGIGLALCKKILDQHGGRIFVSSTLGTGSVFTIGLPANL